MSTSNLPTLACSTWIASWKPFAVFMSLGTCGWASVRMSMNT
ncbi:MAG TPA: hypothetical protein VIL33_06145 [Rhodothermia bacterium]